VIHVKSIPSISASIVETEKVNNKRLAKNEYNRIWRFNNKESVRAANHKYWAIKQAVKQVMKEI